METKKILVIDDDMSFCALFKNALEPQYPVIYAVSAEEARIRSKEASFSLIFLDVILGHENGLDLIKTLKQEQPGAPIIVMSARATAPQDIVHAIKNGAYDYFIKPFPIKDIMTIAHTLLRQKTKPYPAHPIIGQSQQIRLILDTLYQAKDIISPILIEGETGAGKELVAHTVHEWSNRAAGPFIAINCAAIPEQLFESEFFGHEKGAFTDAKQTKKGLFASAHRGTIFLDEISELPITKQCKLLRVLQEKTFRKVGSLIDEHTDVRVIAATNHNLWQQVKKGLFRKDLFFRLNVISVKLPPLRQRAEDIPCLIMHFIEKYTTELHLQKKWITPETIDLLKQYDWPGNIRELENFIQKVLILTHAAVITPDHARQYLIFDQQQTPHFYSSQPGIPQFSLKKGILAYERHMFLYAQKISASAKECMALLGLSKREYYYRLKYLNLSE